MSVEHLPWDSLEGPIYHARELKPRKQWVTYGCWILSAALIIGGIVTALPRSRRIWCAVHTDAVDEKGYSYYREGTGDFLSDEDYHTL